MNKLNIVVTILFFSAMGNLWANPPSKTAWQQIEGVVDIANKPVDQMLNIHKAPVVREVFHKKGTCGDNVRWTKLALTLALVYMTYKQPAVKEAARKITLPIRCMLFAGKELKNNKKNALKKRVKGWQKAIK